MGAAAELLGSRQVADRILAADILAQVRFGDERQEARAVALLLPALEREREPEVLACLIYAFGHTPDERAGPLLLALQNHPSGNVRFALAYALPMYEGSATVSALIRLSSDPDEDVRDWATFGLGSQIERDTREIREALAARLSDPHEDVRAEAMIGLAKRNDARVAPALLQELQSHASEARDQWPLLRDAIAEAVAAASRTSDPSWLPLLAKLQELELFDAAQLEAAITRCAGRHQEG